MPFEFDARAIIFQLFCVSQASVYYCHGFHYHAGRLPAAIIAARVPLLDELLAGIQACVTFYHHMHRWLPFLDKLSI